jgi:hypothetical protein
MKLKKQLLGIAAILFMAGDAFAQTSPIPTSGLKMWLKADAGVTANANNQVSVLADQSGNGNDVTQSITANQPTLVPNAMNGQPVVRFNGSSTYLKLPSSLNSSSALPLTFVMVTRGATSLQGALDSAPSLPNTFRFFSNYVELWSQSPSVTLAPPAAGAITSVISQANGSGNRLLDVYLNGSEQGGGVKTGNTSPVAFTNGQIGRINTGYYYNGDIAEVLVYNRALSTAERQQVEGYLNGKYGVAVPSGLTVSPISSTQAALCWNWAGNAGMGVQVERKDGESGTFSVVATLTGSPTTFVDENLSPGIQYIYQISGIQTQSITLEPGIPTVPTGGLNLWLAAGAGVTSSGANNQVSVWTDLSAHGNVAQTVAGNQPALVSNVMNGQPVVRFNGASTYLNLNSALNGTSALPMSVFVVTHGTSSLQGAFDSAPNQSTTLRFFQNYVELWNQSPSITLVPPAAGAITSVVTQTYGTGNREMDAFLNGAQQGHTFGNTSPAVINNGQIGRINTGYYYNGDVAEVLVYNQALSTADRQRVEAYLNAKYSIVQAPATPTGVSVSQIDPTENLVTWSTTPSSVEVTYQVWRQDSTGQWVLAGTVVGGGTFLDSGLSPNGSYSYEVLATSLGGTSAFSPVTAANQAGPNVVNVPTDGMQLWLMGDGAWDSSLEYWQDYSGNGNNAWQSSTANQPTVTPSVLNGKPVVHFNAASAQYLRLPNFLAGAAGGEIFTVVRAANTTSNSALWTFGAGNGEWYLYSNNGDVYSDFGSTAQKNEGVPAQDITQFHVYEESSQSGLWQSWLDGIPFYETQTNTVSFPGAPYLGKGLVGYFSGDVAEVIVYNRTLTDAERKSVLAYLDQKYALVAAPPAPTGLQAFALNATTNLVSWNAPVAKSEVDYQVWRQSGSGSWTQLATVENGGTYLDAAVTGACSYKVLAVNGAGTSAFTSPVSVLPTGTAVANFPTNGMKLWLMADGAWESPAGYWPDYSGNGNDAWQNGPIAQKPTVTPAALNGKPVVHFTTSQNLTLPNLMVGATAGEIIAVVRNTNTKVDNGLWSFGTAAGDSYVFADNGNIYGSFGSTSQYREGIPTQDVTQFHVLEESSQTGLWQSWMDGIPLFSNSSNVVAFNSAPTIGNLSGDIAEIIVYNRSLSDAERQAVQAYLNTKYAIYPLITNSGTVNVTVGVPFQYQITTQNNPAGYGVSIDPSVADLSVSSTGLVSGVFLQSGTFTLGLDAYYANETFSGNITVIATQPTAPPVINSPSKAFESGTQSPFTYQITTANGATSFTVVGLPAGLTYDPILGTITGTCAIPGVYDILVTASNAMGVSTASFQLTVDGGTSQFGWSTTDIGSPGIPGGTLIDPTTGIFTLQGSGADIGGTADGCQFAYQQLVGDGQIVARILNVDPTSPNAKAGVMIRGTTDAGAAEASVMITSDGALEFLQRTGMNGNTSVQVFGTASLPVWVKLAHTGSSFTASESSDGVNWTQIGQQTISMAGTTDVGVAVASGTESQVCWATFDLVAPGQPFNVAVTSPTGSATFVSGTPILLSSTAQSGMGSAITKLEYYSGSTKIGESTAAPFNFTWLNPPIGSATIYALAIDDSGASALSSPVSINVNLDANGDATLPDAWQMQYFGHTGVDPNALAPGGGGLTNAQCYLLGLDPTVRDTDGDGIADGDAVAAGLDPSAGLLGFQVYTPLQLNH